MNRYSLVFAAMVAVSFITPPTRNEAPFEMNALAGKSAAVHGNQKPSAENSPLDLDTEIGSHLVEFLSQRTEVSAHNNVHPLVLFATVPHPIETHLAADFDENVAALESGITDSGYFFDSAWIPWESNSPHERLSDSILQKQVSEYRDGYPGVLLFRRDVTFKSDKDPYANGLIVFLIAEKPTAGIELQQADKALDILRAMPNDPISLEDPIRIAGPTYTGSLASLGVLIARLHREYRKPRFFIRSGVLGADPARQMLVQLARSDTSNELSIDFGTSGWCYSEWTGYAEEQLTRMGMESKEIAFLHEDESGYGALGEQPTQSTQPVCRLKDKSPTWQIPFPRDISSLRTSYEKQGIFQSNTIAQPWRRNLDLRSDESGEGDTVPAFGNEGTVAQQESIMLGISAFIKAHHIRAIIISATNVQDLYFLTQFLHANNDGLRIVLVGSTRLFLRGNTAPFRGDLIVDSFPMLPRLPEWTAGALGPYHVSAEHIFSTGFAEGLFFSTVDLLADQRDSLAWLPEYSAPQFRKSNDTQGNQQQTASSFFPPMYLTAFGVNSVWPAGMDLTNHRLELSGASLVSGPSGAQSSTLRMEMPFALFAHSGKQVSPLPGIELRCCALWTDLFGFLLFLGLGYTACFLYARPILRSFCASFEPVKNWRYWFFTVTLPALIMGGVFFMLAWPLWPLSKVSTPIEHALWLAVTSSIVLPLLISVAALSKARLRSNLDEDKEDDMPVTGMNDSELPQMAADAPDPFWTASKLLSFLPTLIFLIAAFARRIQSADQPDTSTLLNAYRKMHWESGLSLLPSFCLVLLALFIWCRLASQSTALMNGTPRLPDFFKDGRISGDFGKRLAKMGSPFPRVGHARWLWIEWAIGVGFMFSTFFFIPALREVTTLESRRITIALMTLIMVAAALMLFDILQFLWTWNWIHGLLRALGTCFFKRSFVVIDDFPWTGLWSFTGVSYVDRRAVLSSLVDCLDDLVKQSFLEIIQDEQTRARCETKIRLQQAMRLRYRTTPLNTISPRKYRRDLRLSFRLLQKIGNTIAAQLEREDYPRPHDCEPCSEAMRRAVESKSESKNSRFRQEAEEFYRLQSWQQTAERYICLLYVAFLQTFIARLHCLMISVGGMFSAMAIAIAIYPFTPVAPFFLGGLAFLTLIAWAFFHVFSQMDKDPVLARIVNGDDRKLQWSFYGKFAESLALPVFTLVSSLLPGGAGRFLDIAQKFLEHGQ